MATATIERGNIRIGRVVVTGKSDAGWHCICKCGGEFVVASDACDLPRHCGCRFAVKRHSPEYHCWRGMIDRCVNPKASGYGRYGGRGITVDERWFRSFDALIEDVGRRPGPGWSLDRIDNNGNYVPGNVRWATRKQQENNKSNNRLLTHDGTTRTVAQWAQSLGINENSLRTRLRLGWGVGRALGFTNEDITAAHGRGRPRREITHDGKTLRIEAWALLTGLNSKTIRSRLSAGWSIERTLTIARANRRPRHVVITVNGRTMSVAEWCSHLQLPYNRIHRRINKGWSPSRALFTPLV